jgi:hypothetical protein
MVATAIVALALFRDGGRAQRFDTIALQNAELDN